VDVEDAFNGVYMEPGSDARKGWLSHVASVYAAIER